MLEDILKESPDAFTHNAGRGQFSTAPITPESVYHAFACMLPGRGGAAGDTTKDALKNALKWLGERCTERLNGSGRHNWFKTRSTSPLRGKKRDSTGNSKVCSYLLGRYYAATKSCSDLKAWNRSKGAKEACSYGNMALPSGCSASNWRILILPVHYGTQHFCKRWREHANRERCERLGRYRDFLWTTVLPVQSGTRETCDLLLCTGHGHERRNERTLSNCFTRTTVCSRAVTSSISEVFPLSASQRHHVWSGRKSLLKVREPRLRQLLFVMISWDWWRSYPFLVLLCGCGFYEGFG